jgi:hypothetical protein
MASAILAALPLVLEFPFFLHQIIKGIATTGFGGQVRTGDCSCCGQSDQCFKWALCRSQGSMIGKSWTSVPVRGIPVTIP